MNPIRSLSMALLLAPLQGLPAPCTSPSWETVASLKPPQGPTVRVRMQPLATLAVPAGFKRVSASPHGSLAFGDFGQADSSVLLMFETKETASLHQRSSPHALFAAIFGAEDAAACKYLAEGFQLEQKDYRLRIVRSADVRVYVFGSGGQHTFYLLDRRKPDFVLVGSLKNASRAEAEAIVSTIETD